MASCDWQHICNTTIQQYLKGIEGKLLDKQRLLSLLNGGRPSRPYIDRRTPAQKLRDKQRWCIHDFTKHRGSYRFRHCALPVSAQYARGYAAGLDRREEED